MDCSTPGFHPSPTPGAYSNSCPSSQWCHPPISSSVVPFSLPSILPSIRVFSNESVLRIRWPKYWSFSFSFYGHSVHSVQSLSCVWLFMIPWTTARQASLSITNCQSLPKPMSIESVMPSYHFILCRLLLLLPSIFQHQGLFKWVSCSHQVAKVLEFQLQHQSFQWTPRTDLL